MTRRPLPFTGRGLRVYGVLGGRRGAARVCGARPGAVCAARRGGVRRGRPGWLGCAEGHLIRRCGATFPLRTELSLRESPVLRSAYFPKTVHWTVLSKTLDLQGCAPPGEPSRGSLLGGFGYDDTIFPWRLPPFSIRNEPRSCTTSFFSLTKRTKRRYNR